MRKTSCYRLLFLFCLLCLPALVLASGCRSGELFGQNSQFACPDIAVEEEFVMDENGNTRPTSIPPIDRTVPEKLETATFALG